MTTFCTIVSMIDGRSTERAQLSKSRPCSRRSVYSEISGNTVDEVSCIHTYLTHLHFPVGQEHCRPITHAKARNVSHLFSSILYTMAVGISAGYAAI